MAKTKKKNGKRKVFVGSKERAGRTLSALCEEQFLVVSKAMKKITQSRGTFALSQDYTYEFRKRRAKAVLNLASEAEVRLHSACAKTPENFKWQEYWVETCSLPITTYDLQEEGICLSLAASIWMLDELSRSGHLGEAMQLLPKEEELRDELWEEEPDIWHPSYSNELLSAMRQVILLRNEDCIGIRQKENSLLRRVFMDEATISGKQHQDVPSRNRWEGILALIPEEVKEQAVDRFTQRVWDWMVRVFRCRMLFCSKEQEIDQRLERLYQQIEQEEQRIEENRKRLQEQKKGAILFGGAKDPLGLMKERKNDKAEVFSSLNALSDEYDRRMDQRMELFDTISRVNFRMSSYVTGNMTPNKEIAEEFREIWKDFSFGDPYEACFALFLLLDSGSDLPWLYYPCTCLIECAGAHLPWYYRDFEEWAEEESHREAQPEEAVEEKKTDWYERRFLAEESEEDEKDYRNLAQLLYRMTGTIVPQTMDWEASVREELRRLGMQEGEEQRLLLHTMALLDEARYRMELPIPMEPEELDEEETIDPAEEAESLRERIAQLKKENDRLKAAAYEAGKSLREAKKRAEEQEKAHELEHQELVSIRELMFAQKEQAEEEIQTEETLTFPCSTTHRIISFGGHDSWAREIRKKLPDVRFVERDKLPNSETIRNADVVWVQSNSLSHAYYYKIIEEARRYSIPVRYYSYASAVKCAEQLVLADREMN